MRCMVHSGHQGLRHCSDRSVPSAAQALWVVVLQINGVGAAPQAPLEGMLLYLLDEERSNGDIAALATMC